MKRTFSPENGVQTARSTGPRIRDTDDQVLQRALRLDEGCWTELQHHGATDAQIVERLATLWDDGQVVSLSGGRLFSVRGRPHPALWLDTAAAAPARKAPALLGPDLVAAVRRVAAIPAPRAEGSLEVAVQPSQTDPSPGLRIEETRALPLTLIDRSPFQTRDAPPAAWLQEIVASLRADGQLTSCLVRRVGIRYELLAGHTRLAAATQLQWPTLRCDITTCDDATAAKIVFLENAKRRDLTVIERARGLARLRDVYKAAGLTQAQAAKDAGISESQFSNLLRLLRLPQAFQERLVAGHLTIEQARALATYADYEQVLKGFQEHLAKQGWAEGPLAPSHFESALQAGMVQGSRPMTQYFGGRGCLFRPTAAQAQQLDIREVVIRGTKERRAFNVKLWNQLQRAAKARIRARKTAPEANETESATGQQRDRWRFDLHLERTWQRAYARALAPLIVRGKLSRLQRQALLRCTALYHLLPFPEEPCTASEHGREAITAVETLFRLNDRDWEEHCLTIIRQRFQKLLPEHDDWHGTSLDLPLEAWQVLGGLFGVDAATHFQPSPGLLQACGDRDLRQIARAFGLETTGPREDLLHRLASVTWPPPEWPACWQRP